ncbi:MAG: DUF1285 domain-containing protein [Deltaproteobacteria bacterium]|nr:DUF1285 domain-containing protein [Deltaproteobacteria bacterium]MBW2018217.1 DUF1285 domain-containing protein [Deltaproteobacteria bacterium]MBW2129841.1 DUF1285 domain-containing protein [Deltaproteobacteria bacterium]MBW2305203.1 DUF1285 domain-containing protein [Deltaproteobacteria bacterium]
MNASETPPCSIFIDKEGRWFFKGIEMVRRDFIRMFYQQMQADSEGRYIITLAGDRCIVEVEDTPFVVWRTIVKTDDSLGKRYVLYLSDESEEELDPETLFVGKGNVLYCKVKAGMFPARFNRAAYYQLAEHIEEENGKYVITSQGKRYLIGIKTS